MADILNLVPKKDVFDAIMNGTSNELTIDNTPYWKKRLMESNFTDFKDYKILRISCGSPEKFDFEIDDMQLADDKFVITIEREEKKPSAEELIKKIEEETDLMNEVEPIVEKKHVYEAPKVEIRPINVESLKDRVKKVIEDFIKNKNVFVVPTPVVTIRPDGRIVGTINRLLVDRDLDVSFTLTDDETVLYKGMTDDQFVEWLKMKLKKYLAGNYVFVCPSKSGWIKWNSGEDAYILRIAARKKYLIGKR